MMPEIARRDFLKLVGVGAGSAAAAGCSDHVEKLIPYVVQPEEIIPGLPVIYASTSALYGASRLCRVSDPTGERPLNAYGYSTAQTLVQVLKQCGDDLTRENVMTQAANLKNFDLPLLLPGIRINTSPTDYRVIRQVQLQRFDGKEWVRFGDVIGN